MPLIRALLVSLGPRRRARAVRAANALFSSEDGGAGCWLDGYLLGGRQRRCESHSNLMATASPTPRTSALILKNMHGGGAGS